jgi:DNA-binding winged helix-turn-helix (wHTH) protein
VTAAEESPPPALCLGPYHLEGREGLLWRHDHVVALSPKAVAVLWRLISRAGRLVSKAELFAAAWPETAVTEGGLAVRIRELRRALGNETQRPRYIETVHRRGYRFVAPVTTAPQVGGTRQVSRQPPALPRSTLSPQPCCLRRPGGRAGAPRPVR